jgi:ribokinase
MDFFAIGDTVLDTFIRLEDAQVNCDVNNEHCTITMRFGDKIPYEFAKVVPAVGNSANGAVSAARLGLSAALLSAVGKDRDGEACIARFTEEKVATNYIATEDGKTTNSHYVLWYGPERTILIKHEAFEYKLPDPLPAPKAVYLSSIGESGVGLHDPIADWLEKTPEILLVFQPGTFQMKVGMERLARIYKRADVFFANKEEYQRILGSTEMDVKKLMREMQSHGPKTCVLTDGGEGAYGMNETGVWKIPVHPVGTKPYERTGAGDGFASTTTVALMLGKSLPEALAWGGVNGAFVTQKIGAQEGLLTRVALEHELSIAPSDYKAVAI